MTVKKDANTELPVPSEWRNVLEQIANAFVENNFPTEPLKSHLGQYRESIIAINQANIKNYPDEIGLLNSKSWDTSCYLWMEDSWDVLLDLSDENGETTDLVLHVTVKENADSFIFEPYLIYVP